MKKILLYGLMLVLTSCATIAHESDSLTEYQTTPGIRKIAWGFFIADLICPPSLIVDFITQKIYREYPKGFHPYPVARTVTKEYLKNQRKFERQQK